MFQGLFEIGAGNEIRTRDLNLGKVALYQLSYSRICSQLSIICFVLRWMNYRANFQIFKTCREIFALIFNQCLIASFSITAST